MSTTAAPVSGPALATRERGAARRLVGAAVFLWKGFFGALLCTNLLTAVVVAGWLQRVSARSVLRHWWKRSPARRNGVSFEAFVSADEASAGSIRWPNWCLAPAAERARRPRLFDSAHPLSTRLAAVPRAMLGSLFTNARLGIQVLFNTWVMTLPGCALWLFGWFAGWNNSFHKGYELAFVGPTTALIGVALFVAAMFYVPAGQVRQAVSGERRRFFDVGLFRRLNRSSPSARLATAAAYALVALPISIAFVLPGFFPQMSPALGELGPEEARAFLERYYFWVAVVGLGAVTSLRLLSARVYASTLLDGVAKGVVASGDLTAAERSALGRLDLLTVGDRPSRHFLTKVVAWMGARVFRVLTAAGTLALWLAFVLQIFVREFLQYHPVIGWLNQAVVHLPYFSLIPPQLGG